MDRKDRQVKGPESSSRRDFLKTGVRGACVFLLAGMGISGLPEGAEAQAPRLGFSRARKSPWFSARGRSRLRCELCPKKCLIEPGRRGACRVRENRGGEGVTLAYGNPCLVQIDPVERKPFFHVKPGTKALSVSTAGCPLECKFCEVWDMALSAPEEVYAYDLSPADIVKHARTAGAKAVSCAFGEPVAFFEYAADIFAEAKRAGLTTLMHTSGFVSPEPLEEILGNLDAVNVDLKSFDPRFYRDMTGGDLDPVLAVLKRLKSAGVHVEITNLVIPTLNDDPRGIRNMALWIRDELGPDVPLHFARFYPLYKLANLPPTPVSSLDRARDAARNAGLRYVYVSRVTGHEGENTFCPSCGEKVVERLGFVIERVRLAKGRCEKCGTPIPGLWS